MAFSALKLQSTIAVWIYPQCDNVVYTFRPYASHISPEARIPDGARAPRAPLTLGVFNRGPALFRMFRPAGG